MCIGANNSVFALSWVFSIYVNLVKGASMDEHRETKLNIDAAHAVDIKQIELERANGDGIHDKSGAREIVESI